jgi:tetratricopeptide (TPR) repeat protein
MRFALPVIILTLGSVKAFPQGAANPDFDDLARRAAAVLESRPEEAAKLYREAIAIRPTWAEGWFYLGASEYELRRYSEARQALKRAGELAATNGATWAFLGLAEYELGDYAAALTHIVKAEGLGLPDNPQFVSVVRVRAALIAMRSSDFTAAIDQLRPLATIGDSSPGVIEAFGVAALTMPYLPSDVPSGKRGLVNAAGRAIWSLYAQRTGDAGALFEQLGEQYPKEPGVHYLRGIYFVDRDTAAALAEFASELRVSPSHVLARVQIAILQIRAGAPGDALEPAREAVRLEPGNFLCHLALGRALLALEKTGPAIQEFEAAVKIAPAYPHTHFYLGQGYRQAGRDSDARREYAEFSRLKDAGPAEGTGLPPEK